jgi:outer membrane protein OmpA-like peptidoglycan-associated protein
MKNFNRFLFVSSIAMFAGSCAASLPNELATARESYRRASTGPAGKIAPAEVHAARLALAQAETSFKKHKNTFATRDLSYVAQRRAELAEATASILSAQKNQSRSQDDYERAQGNIVASTKVELAEAQDELADSERSGELGAQKLAAEKDARIAAEERAAAAQAALAKLASVKEEPRGMVITLSGSVLFASDQSVLLGEARARLDQVAAVLLSTRERNITVEGHTDSRGSHAHNLDLSQRRADAVRNYLVQKSYEPDRIMAHGLGEAQPVADNTNSEGRANNRRVEIIIAPERRASNP